MPPVQRCQARQVHVRDLETGAVRHLTSDAEGYYSAPSLSIGRYQVTAEKEGFNTQSETGINLVVGQNAVVDIALAVGKVEQRISVTDVPLAINVTTQQTSGLVSARQVKELPLNGRSYDELITLNPATVNFTAERTMGRPIRTFAISLSSTAPMSFPLGMASCCWPT